MNLSTLYILLNSPSLGAPPAYSATRRSSYTERTSLNGSGTVVREADLGTGVDTIRPIKKVDPVGSLRLSAEFVGSMKREGNGSTSRAPSSHQRAVSETSKAGRAMVDEVVIPILQMVGLDWSLFYSYPINYCRLFEMIWMPERSNLSVCCREGSLSSRRQTRS